MVKKNSQHKNPFSLFTYIRFELIYIYFLLDRRPRGFRCGIARAAPRPLPRAFPRPLPLPRAPRPRPRPRPLFGGVAAFFFFPATIFLPASIVTFTALISPPFNLTILNRTVCPFFNPH